jgi:hypothetical protein
MMNVLFLLLTLFSLLQGKPIQGVGVSGYDVFNTGPFDCVPEKRAVTEWVNDIGDIKIYNAKLWMGANTGAVADVGVIVYRKGDESLLFHENWDRYAEPTGFHIDSLNLSPNYMTLKKGESLELTYWCHPFNEHAKKAHVIITIWYSKEPLWVGQVHRVGRRANDWLMENDWQTLPQPPALCTVE